MRLWCEHAWLGGERTTEGVLIEVEEDRITAVTPAVPTPPTDAVRLDGVTLPGFVNAHSHAFHRALRGRTHAGQGSFWSWREQMYRLAATLTPESYGELATAVFAEMVLTGITTVGEFHYLHHGPGGTPYDDPNAVGAALADAAEAAGIRLTLIDTCYLQGGVGRDLDDVQRRFSDGTADAWAERAGALTGSSTRRIGAAVHSCRAVAPAEMEVVGAWVVAHGAPVHAHVSEQPAENEACLAAYGRTPVGLLADAGLLGEQFTAVHATHLTVDDIDALGGSQVCICPTTERDLADGIGPAAALAAAGAGLCLGSDSHAIIDLLEEGRAVELDERLATGRRGHHTAGALLHAATSGGAASLGWPDSGRLEPGALADLAVVGLGSVRLAGSARDDLVPAVVHAATAADVEQVMVAGRWMVRDGRHVALDVAPLLERTIGGVWAS